MLPKLFACMILRNEAHNLPRCLDSIKDLCDQIVVVDTGSTDDTVKICREYGAIVYTSPQMNWRKPPIWDFSFARNESLQYCEDMGADWVMIIDADESLSDVGIPDAEFKRRLSRLPSHVHALATQVHEKQADGSFCLSFWGTRFFRTRVGVFYDGICHNRPHLIKGGFSAGSNVVFYHHGYTDKQVMTAKRARTLILIEKRIKDDPNDYEAYYYKCMTLCGQDRVEDAIEAGVKCLEMLGPMIDHDPSRLNYFGILYYAIGWAWFRIWEKTDNQEAANKAYVWWLKGWEYWPEDIDLNFELCTIGYLTKDPYMTKDHGERYFTAIEKMSKEIAPDLPKFENAFDIQSLTIGPRHIHQASPKHQAMIRAMMQHMEK